MKLRVGIVGCGVAGLSAGLALAREGHGVTILEKSDRVGPVGAGVEIRLCCAIGGFKQVGNRVLALDEMGEVRGEFDLLIGADGARSAIRSSGFEASVYQYPHGALWALGECDSVRDHLFQYCHGTRILCGLLPMGERRCSLFWSVENDAYASLVERGWEAFVRGVVSVVPEAGDILSKLGSFEEVRFTRYAHVRMKSWHVGRCVLIGDAAHAMSPHLGQGINLAMLDGLAIAEAIGRSGSIEGALARYEESRRGHVNYYSWVTYLLSPFFQSRGRVLGVMRDIGLPVLPRVPVVRGQMLLTMTGMKRSALGGRMSG